MNKKSAIRATVRCIELWSDNGTNFRGAAAELSKIFKSVLEFFQKTATLLVKEDTQRSFIPPSAPHFGGLWEIGVKSVKHHLRRAIGEHTLTYEEMSTLLCQIEACLNSRPLYQISNDPNDLNPLTPGHFLIGEPLTAIPEPCPSSSIVSRYKQVTHMRNCFLSKW